MQNDPSVSGNKRMSLRGASAFGKFIKAIKEKRAAKAAGTKAAGPFGVGAGKPVEPKQPANGAANVDPMAAQQAAPQPMAQPMPQPEIPSFDEFGMPKKQKATQRFM